MFLIWPLVSIVIWALVVIGLVFVDKRAAMIAGAALVVYGFICFLVYLRSRAVLLKELVSFGAQYSQVQKGLLQEFVLPYALLDNEGVVLWMNNEFRHVSGKDASFNRPVEQLFPEITKEQLPIRTDRTECEVRIGQRDYRAAMQRVQMDDLQEQGIVKLDRNSYLIALYLFDETEYNELLAEREANRVVCGLINIDNYDEALESVDEVRRSLLMALVDRKISKYFQEVGGVVRKLERDKSFVLLNKSGLDELRANKFSILDDVKTVDIGNSMNVTLSLGIGLNMGSYLEDTEAARVAIDLALGRGGDQVVIKDGEATKYYGGKTDAPVSGNRVKARVKAHALRETISDKDRVVIMGHKVTDVDVFGAAAGLYAAARTMHKEAHIVIDENSASIRILLDDFRAKEDYPADLFVDREKAKEIVNENTALIVVDTNRGSYTECEELLGMTDTVIVLDHHRQSRDAIRNAVLSYIETTASSACEMVAEVLQYSGMTIRLKKCEANALYAGIMIDTNNFITRTGARTFEAAAYLRRNGADVTYVRKLFRDTIEEYRARATAIAGAEVYRDSYAIASFSSKGLENPTVICAQAANELLNVVGVKASFVLTNFQDKVYISARAIDEINVQLIMERLGGGGHMTIAGAQLDGVTVDEAVDLLKQTIARMTEEGEIG